MRADSRRNSQSPRAQQPSIIDRRIEQYAIRKALARSAILEQLLAARWPLEQLRTAVSGDCRGRLSPIPLDRDLRQLRVYDSITHCHRTSGRAPHDHSCRRLVVAAPATVSVDRAIN